MIPNVKPALINAVCARLRDNKRVRRSLPEWGRIHIDRQLPFLCIYRRPTRGGDEGTARLATTEASYLICSGKKNLQPGISALVSAVAGTIVDQFGACLLLELWTAPQTVMDHQVSRNELTPEFRIVATRRAGSDQITDALAGALRRVSVSRKKARVTSTVASKSSPRALLPVLPADVASEMGCFSYGLEIAPIFRDAATGEVYPNVLSGLRRSLTMAFRRAFFEFARAHTTHQPPHYHAMGRRAVVRAVWDVDRILAEASDQFDFLLEITPVNGEQAWRAFRRSGLERAPIFHYRPLPAEPVTLKRILFRAPVERVEDPALGQIFRAKISDVDRQITMLQDRNTGRFLHGSIQLFGGVEPELLELALDILTKVPPRDGGSGGGRPLRAEQFARLAQAEIESLQALYPQMKSSVEIREDINGLMVSRGNLLIGTGSAIPASRADALLQHEIGTHILTYHNGRSQPFRQLYSGLAGYDALQEGLAVLAEYLVGGLTATRLRQLAVRVVAIGLLISGADFVENHRVLTAQHGFSSRGAFSIALRTYRGGGLTKDAVYLRGLLQLMEYIRKGGDLAPLFVGKIALEHVPIIRELLWRGVIHQPPLQPRYMGLATTEERLVRLREGLPIIELTKRSKI